MAGNFEFLQKESQFKAFAKAAADAETCFSVSPLVCAVACRLALESAVKWVYSVDESLTKPWDDQLSTLIFTDDFRALLPPGLFPKINFIRKTGNIAAHGTGNISRNQALLALENLHSYLSFVGFCYTEGFTEQPFDRKFLEKPAGPAPVQEKAPVLSDLIKENEPRKKVYTIKRRAAQKKGFTVRPADLSEAETRKAYIDTMLQDAGWQRGRDWEEEYPIGDMPNTAGSGAADYVLLDDSGIPLAVVEAKKTSVSVERGRHQACLYADFLEKRFRRRPLIFLTNGYETRLNDGVYPERQVSGIYAKRDMERTFALRRDRRDLSAVHVKDAITDRPYQKRAIQAVCDALGSGRRRKALLVMATGSGKTRVVLSLVDVLIRQGWVRNFLFLADRKPLVSQAFKVFHNFMDDLTVCNLCKNKQDAAARGVFSTYQTMMNCIDDAWDKTGGKLFTPGHFDLIIVDEAHRSIYKKYQEIFTYFDAFLVGLTATPKADVGKSTYEIFDLQNNNPTFAYELAEAVEQGYLVDFVSVETKMKFLDQGIHYNDLSDEDKEKYEDTFTDEDGKYPASIEPEALNKIIFNHDTIRLVLDMLMTQGLRIDQGSRVGKTIIFAKNHDHAEKILEVWGKEYPEYGPEFCLVVDNYINYAEDLIERFQNPEKVPQVVISVDMLDTGIDVEEILNLVFFKKVYSKTKFWQMIGRGTRLCPGLIDGEDKKYFYIFDFCDNFAFFRMNPRERTEPVQKSIQEKIFNLKITLIQELQEHPESAELQEFRGRLIEDVASRIAKLNKENFAVHQHLRYVDRYARKESFYALSGTAASEVTEHLSPLMPPDAEDISALRFDALLYQIEYTLLAGKAWTRFAADVQKKCSQLSLYFHITQVRDKKELIERIARGKDLDSLRVDDWEAIRQELRGLITFIDKDERVRYDTNFTDDITSVEYHEPEYGASSLEPYRKRVNYYITSHQDVPVIAKLKGNIPLTRQDTASLEEILWKELGTRDEYHAEYGDTPLGELVRSVTGLDTDAVNHAFSRFLNAHELNSSQMYFVDQVVKYVSRNGLMKDLVVLTRSPFNNRGNLSEIFTDDSVFSELMGIIEKINKNAVA